MSIDPESSKPHDLAFFAFLAFQPRPSGFPSACCSSDKLALMRWRPGLPSDAPMLGLMRKKRPPAASQMSNLQASAVGDIGSQGAKLSLYRHGSLLLDSRDVSRILAKRDSPTRPGR